MQYTPKGFEAILGRSRGEIKGLCGEDVERRRYFSIPHKEWERNYRLQITVFLARGDKRELRVKNESKKM